jgi:type I restriction enzyme S subunit
MSRGRRTSASVTPPAKPVPPASSTDLPDGFKMTELGPLPEEWEVVRLGDVVSLGSDAVNPAHVAAGRYVGLEHIEPGSTRTQKWGHPSEVRSLKTAFRPGDVLYGKLRPYLDKAALAEWGGICSTDILVLRAQNAYSDANRPRIPIQIVH